LTDNAFTMLDHKVYHNEVGAWEGRNEEMRRVR
jgi:hypothetical protein